jgi:3'-phosphoadenosine 5'-phosphosulfate sulfotransferase (PAPS reductase)/FAD synthetase
MIDPFKIEGPAVISFSGGRTSGYMLWRILQAHNGTLPADVVVVFANTGKEMVETLDFVQECSERWSVPITWVEYQNAEKPSDRWRVVTHATASRNGEPFAANIGTKNFLPNPVTRFCTSELKVKAMHRYLIATFGWEEWVSVIGIRADEPRRVARISVPNRDRDERVAPLAAAGVSSGDVGAFWASQPFDLRLPNMNGKTMHGNCDLCFLKGADQILSLIREKPERAIWWMEQEKRLVGKSRTPASATFRYDRPSYTEMHRMATQHGELFNYGDEPIQDCMCVD